MTLAEIKRAIASKVRIKKIEQQERASYDYILADLVGRSVARVYSNSAKLPEINEIYPTLFDTEEIQQKKQANMDQLSILRFKQFADFHNNKNKGVQK